MDILKKYDQWTWERLSRHLLYWSTWTVFLVTLNSLTGKQYTLGQWIAFEAVVLPVKITSSYVIAYGLMPRFLYTKRYGYFLVSILIAALFFGGVLYLVYSECIHPVILRHSEHYPIGEFVYKGVELLYIAGMVLGIKFFQNYLHEQQNNQALAQQKVEAELKYLKNQIQPHFLFNTLNNIYGMMLSNDKNAAEYMVKLSDLLSYMIYESDVQTIALSKEVELLDSFIELERLRYHRKLDFNYRKTNISPYLKVAPLLMVPFVENAFKHGPAEEDGKSFIDIQIEVQNNLLYFSIENSYSKHVNTRTLQSGIGLENIKKRLELLYPEKHTLNILKDTTFKVSLIIELSE